MTRNSLFRDVHNPRLGDLIGIVSEPVTAAVSDHLVVIDRDAVDPNLDLRVDPIDTLEHDHVRVAKPNRMRRHRS